MNWQSEGPGDSWPDAGGTITSGGWLRDPSLCVCRRQPGTVGSRGSSRQAVCLSPVLEGSALEIRPGDVELQQPLMTLSLLPHHYRGSCIMNV